MKVILLKDVPKLGQRNEVKEVKDGYALNLLLPKKLAEQATLSSLKRLERIKEIEGEVLRVKQNELEKLLSGIEKIEIKAKANEKGHLFAGVGKEEISKRSGIPVDNIILNHPIKEIGEHEIEVRVGEKGKKIRIDISS